MPELPEVTTIVRDLTRAVRGKVIRDIETETPKLVRPLTVAQFRNALRGQTFLGFTRRAKFIIARLGARSGRQPPVSGRRLRAAGNRQPDASDWVLLWHMGMTGHPLYRSPKQETQNQKLAAAFRDPRNQHVRLTFQFTDGTRLEYSDVRKFGKIELVRSVDLARHPQLSRLGPEALDLAGDPLALGARLRTRKKALKVALLDQSVVAGIGNIYADEILWTSRLHPRFGTARLTPAHCRTLARAIRSVLQSAIRAHGTSVDDYRRPDGTKGGYGPFRKVYQRTGLPCRRCGTLIQRLVVGGRGTHVCPHCQRSPR